MLFLDLNKYFLQIPVTFLGILLIDKSGRRPLLMVWMKNHTFKFLCS